MQKFLKSQKNGSTFPCFIPFSYSVPISVQYDKSFKTAWGAKSLFAIRGMLAIVQNIYRWDTWKVKLEFQLVSQIIFNSRRSFKIARFFTPDGGVTDNEADNLYAFEVVKILNYTLIISDFI